MAIISEKIIGLLNDRIVMEEESSRLYKAIGICMGYKGYFGAEKLFAAYAKEELEHAEWAYEYLLSLDIKPITPALKAPPATFEGLIEVLQMAFDHEILITKSCKELAKACMDETDYITFTLAEKYLAEQINEIDKTTSILDFVDTMGEKPSLESMRLLDNYLNTLV